jgi:hypothetical protein
MPRMDSCKSTAGRYLRSGSELSTRRRFLEGAGVARYHSMLIKFSAATRQSYIQDARRTIQLHDVSLKLRQHTA